MSGFKAILRKGKVAYPKAGYFDTLEAAVEFAKRKQDVFLAWMFATCPAQDPRRHHALDPSLKIAVRQLWDGDPTAPEPAPEPLKPSNEVSIPPAPKTPVGAPEVPGPTIPSAPPEPEPEPAVKTPAIPPPALHAETEPEETKTPTRKRQRRRKRKSDD